MSRWRSLLARAIHQNRSLPYSRYFQLATIRADQRPANRTVVFRGFLGDDQLKIITDFRSAKVEQIQHLAWGEACWYFAKTREQFRLSGQLTLIDAEYPDADLQKARQTTWHDLSDAARVQFTWHHPGQTRTEDNEAFSAPPPNDLQPLDNFCLLLLAVVEVDHLELRGEPQKRSHYQNIDNHWTEQAINP
ncbi:MAG: Npun_F5749 family FMN-dependent PPOX-type flavoprotein [Coleofasciculaceae cyanobacterium]